VRWGRLMDKLSEFIYSSRVVLLKFVYVVMYFGKSVRMTRKIPYTVCSPRTERILLSLEVTTSL